MLNVFALPRDKKLHLLGGLLFAAGAAAMFATARWLGPGYAIVFSSVVMGWAVERYQAIRREGTPDKLDWLCSSLPGVLAGAALEMALLLGWVPPWA